MWLGCLFFEVWGVCVGVCVCVCVCVWVGDSVWVTVGVLVLGPHLSGVLQVRIVGLLLEAVSIRVG
jgi:Flp pilus assembly protein TadB